MVANFTYFYIDLLNDYFEVLSAGRRKTKKIFNACVWFFFVRACVRASVYVYVGMYVCVRTCEHAYAYPCMLKHARTRTHTHTHSGLYLFISYVVNIYKLSLYLSIYLSHFVLPLSPPSLSIYPILFSLSLSLSLSVSLSLFIYISIYLPNYHF